MSGEYIITAEYDINGKPARCLVTLAGDTLECAENVLNRMVNNPTEKDKRLIKTGEHLKVEFVDAKDCWWRYDCD